MRIAVLNSYGTDVTRGGAEVVVDLLVTGLEELGHTVGVFAGLPTPGPQRNLVATVRRHAWRGSPPRHVLNVALDAAAPRSRRLEALLAHYQPEVAFTHNLPGLSTSAWRVAHDLGIPVVHTLHDYYLLCRRTTLGPAEGGPCREGIFCGMREKSIMRYASSVGYVLAPSHFVANRHAGLFPSAPPIEVIVNPAQTSRLSKIPPPLGLKRVGYLGRLDLTKGVGLLLESAATLARLGVRLTIAGGGPLRPQVERAAREGVLDYRGRVDGEQKTAFFTECDAGLAPSLWSEPGGPTLSMSEWLAAGRPVFASDRGGHQEVARRGIGVVAFGPSKTELVRALQTYAEQARFAELIETVRRDVAPSPLSHARRYLAAAESARANLDRAD